MLADLACYFAHSANTPSIEHRHCRPGILSVVMLRASFGVFSGHVVALCAIAALTIFASGAATAGIQAAAGPSGTGSSFSSS